MTTLLTWLALALATMASAGLLLSYSWRWNLAFLSIIYIGVFLLVRLYWPLGMAAIKLITGWVAAAILGMTRLSLSEEQKTIEDAMPQDAFFRLFLAALVGTSVLASAGYLPDLIPGIGLAESAASLMLIGMGLLHLGVTSQPMRVTLGLLTILAGFEILYAVMEGSTLVAGLLAVVNLGLALTGAYFLAAGERESAS